MRFFAAALAVATLSLAFLPQAARAQNEALQPTGSPTHFSIEVVGEGPDVILIPGLSTPRAVWRPAADRLTATRRVHLLQIRGFGEGAGANAAGPLLAPMVEELAAYILQQGLDRPAVVGHSLGGLAAMMLAADHPQAAGRIMIVDALPWYGVLALPPGTEASVAMIEPQARMLRDQLLASHGKPADASALDATAAGQALDSSAQALIRSWIATADPRVTGQLLYDDLTTDMRERIADIKVPVTLVYPWNETYPTQAQADAFYRAQYAALQGVSFVAIGPSGHFAMLDQPDSFEAALAAFLAE